jgi:chromate transporter
VALLFVIAGIIGILLYYPPKSWRKSGKVVFSLLSVPAIAGISATMPILLELTDFFIKAGAFTFGSGLAIVPFLHQGVVLDYQLLNEREFLDAVAVGVITPGPVVITAAFVGYLVAGFTGALVAAAAVFLPVYLFVLFIGRYIIRYRKKPVFQGFVKGASSTASGAIAGASVILAQGLIINIPTAIIGVISLLILWRLKIPEPFLIAAAAIAGVLLYQG